MIFEKLLAVTRQARDRIDFKITSGLDHSTVAVLERSRLSLLVEEAEAVARTGPTATEVLAAQADLLRDYNALELAARVVARVAKEGDQVELTSVTANLERVLRDQRMRRELAERGTSPDGADALRYAVAATQVDIGLKALPPVAGDDGDVFRAACREFVQSTARPKRGCQTCQGTGRLHVKSTIGLGETLIPCSCTLK